MSDTTPAPAPAPARRTRARAVPAPEAAPEAVPVATHGLVQLQVRTVARMGEQARWRAGLRFERQPRQVQVTPEQAQAIRADAMLQAHEDAPGASA